MFLAPLRFAEKRLVGYSQQQMFQIIADVSQYSSFVPYVSKSSLSKTPNPDGTTNAHLRVGYKAFTESYTSKLTLKEPSFVRAQATSSIFSKLLNEWRFSHVDKDQCIIDILVEFQFHSLLYAGVSGVVLDSVARQMVEAFEQRALVLHGPASLKSRTVS